MKNSTLLLLFLFCSSFAQNTIVLKHSGTASDGALSPESPLTTYDFTKTIIISLDPATAAGCSDFSVVKKNANDTFTITKTAAKTFQISGIAADASSIIIIPACIGTSPNFELSIKSSTVKDDKSAVTTTGTSSYATAAEYLVASRPADFWRPSTFYDRRKNRARYFFDQNGILLTTVPVNVDANDYIEITMIVPKNGGNYTAELDCDYDPSDLSQRPTQALGGSAQSGDKQIEFIEIHRIMGPCTGPATIRFFKDGQQLDKQFTIKINPLHHFELAASFVSTDLANPDFEVFAMGDGQNTIRKINDGNRTMATFNVIFYWKPTLEWIKRSVRGGDDQSFVTDGRDVYKEAGFWERLNPTFGVALNQEWDNNLFFGATFEFARGGNLTAGWHYGKIRQLADSNFELGEDVFTGTTDEIRISEKYDWGFYAGITLDARIFNRFFSRN